MPLGLTLKHHLIGPPDTPHVWVLGTDSTGHSRIYVLDPTTLATVRTLTPPSGMTFRAVVPSDNYMWVGYANGTSGGILRYRRDGIPNGGPYGGVPGDCYVGIQAGAVTGGHILFYGSGSSEIPFDTATLSTPGGYSTFEGPDVYDPASGRTFTNFSTYFSFQSAYTPYPTGSPTSYNPTVPSPPFAGDNMFQPAYHTVNPIVVAKPSAVAVNGYVWWVGRGSGNGVGTTNKPAQENGTTFVTTLLDNPSSGSGQPTNTSNNSSTGNQIMNAGICYNSTQNLIYVSYPASDSVSFANGRVDAINPSTSVTTTILSNLPYDSTTVGAYCDSAGTVLWYTDGVGRVCRVDLTVPSITTTVTILPFGGCVNPYYPNLAGGLWYSG